ncbi:hypothetical protein ABK040_007144 [Willaertia magna]
MNEVPNDGDVLNNKVEEEITQQQEDSTPPVDNSNENNNTLPVISVTRATIPNELDLLSRRVMSQTYDSAFTLDFSAYDKLNGLNVQNLNIYKNKSHILHDITCFFPSGQLTAIVGPSGCGKTTFLDVLSQRVKLRGKGNSGSITFKGKKLNKKLFQKSGGYVYQEDILLTTDTIHECLLESALLKTKFGPKGFLQNYREKKERVEQLENDMGLSQAKNVKIGDTLNKAASGGQKRRVSISIQLLNNPEILLLDEYSSGLDSYNSLLIGKALRKLAHEQGKTIISTIHQPSSELFALFDNVLVLAFGKIIYFGPIKCLKEFLLSVGFPLPKNTNPCDWLINIISNPHIELASKRPVVRPIISESSSPISTSSDSNPTPSSTAFDNNLAVPSPTTKKLNASNSLLDIKSKLNLLQGSDKEKHLSIGFLGKEKEDLEQRIETIVSYYSTHYTEKHVFLPSDHRKDSTAPSEGTSTTTPIASKKKKNYFKKFVYFMYNTIVKLLILMFRFIRTTWRDPLIFWSEFVQVLFSGVFAGLLYFQLKNDQQGIIDRISAFYFLLSTASYIPAESVVSVFPHQRSLFIREREANLYGTLLYYVAYSIVHTITEMLFPTIMLLGAYWITGFTNSPEAFFLQLIILIIVQWLCESIGLLAGALLRSVDMGNLIVGVILIVWFCFSGYLIRSEQVGPWFYPLAYTSIFRYSLHAMAQCEFENLKFTCPMINNVRNNVPLLCNFKNETYFNVTSNYQVPLNNYTTEICNSLDWNRTLDIITPTVCISDGKAALSYYFPNFPLWGNFVVLLGMLVVYRILIYLALRFKRW